MTGPLWTIEDVASATGGTLRGPVGRVVGGISIDTRTLAAGDLFVAIRGENRDGHDFVPQAVAAGAAACLVAIGPAFELAPSTPMVVVEDPLEAMRRLGRAARERSRARIIAVTGSVGKTGTKEALRHILAQHGETHASIASYNNHWGVPLTLARMPRSARFGVFEIGMNHAGEIRPLAMQVRPHIALVTTIEPVHLEFFPSVAAIADEKAEVFAGLEHGGTAIVNIDNPHGARVRAHALAGAADRVVTFGASEAADIRLLACEEDGLGSSVRIGMFGRHMSARIGMPGRHIATNMLGVLAAVHALGADVDAAADGLSDLAPPKGRGARSRLVIGQGEALLIDESYNANPASMRAALSSLGHAPVGPGGRRIAVLGDMLELGPEGPDFHAGLSVPVAAQGVDLVFACGPLMARLAEALPPSRLGGYAATSADLESQVLSALRPGDTIMVKGSLGSRMGRIVEALERRYGAGSTSTF
jgi:UDP-N-acetylmuramoyl-tripeptide--D-alanyl-D-alanine ligase